MLEEIRKLLKEYSKIVDMENGEAMDKLITLHYETLEMLEELEEYDDII